MTSATLACPISTVGRPTSSYRAMYSATEGRRSASSSRAITFAGVGQNDGEVDRGR